MPKDEYELYRRFQRPVVKLWMGLYGIGRCGKDFISYFQMWLRYNRWNPMTEEPGLLVYWQSEDDSTVLKRAAHLKCRIDKERIDGKNHLEPRYDLDKATIAGGRSAEDKELEQRKRSAGTAAKCAAMATYVDDCNMDAKKQLRSLMWNVIRLMFKSDDPADVQKILGLVRLDTDVVGAKYAAKLSQRDYVANVL